MKRSTDLPFSPAVTKRSKEDDLPVPPEAAAENELMERRLVNTAGSCKKTTNFIEFKQEMIFDLKVGAQDIKIQLIKTSAGIAQWKVTRGEAWAVHHRNGLMISIGKIIEFNSLLVGSHISCNIVVPGGPAFAWKLSCCVSGPFVEKVQIH